MEREDKKISEGEVVIKTKHPNTLSTLKHDFETLGVKPGSLIVIHSSLSKIGWIVGGAVSLIKAIMEVLTSEGTLVMPTFTFENTEPSRWENPPVPKSWWSLIRNEMPAFEPDIMPTRRMGIVVEIFRKWPGVLRSNHPTSSIAAWGKHAKFLTENHSLTSDLGEGSPFSRIYDLDGQILLVGVTHLNNSSLHLAEYRSDFHGKKYFTNGSAMIVDNQRHWVEWEALDLNSDDFDQLGKDFESKIKYKPDKIGLAEARLISLRDIVDFGVEWLKKNRKNISIKK